MNVEIATYWNVETLYYVFNAVASVMASASFSGLMKFIFIFGLAVAMFGYMGKQMEMAKWFLQALVFTSLLNMPIARVAITDRTGLEAARVVDNVPFAMAVMGEGTNLVFGYLTRTYETVFGVPDDLALQKGDVGFGHRILKQVNNATVRDAQLKADLMQFIKECTLYDIRDGYVTPDDIMTGTAVWDKIFTDTNPARFVSYNTLSSSILTASCKDVAPLLQDRINMAVTAGNTFYGGQVFTRAQTDAIATGMFVATVGTSYDWILNSSQNASDAMKQSMFNNLWREAGTELPALLGDAARIQEVNGLTGAAQAARQGDGSNGVLSLLAQETLPHMRNWIEAIIYALFPVIVILVVLSSAEGAKRIVGGYMMSLAWIGLWPVLFAVINHLSLMHLKHKLAALKLAAGVPFQMADVFDATLGDEQAMIGYMVVLVPFLAGAIVKLGQGGFMGVADRMMSGFASAGASIGVRTASGNQSLGQTGIDTASANSTSMNKYDSAVGLTAGGSQIRMNDGSTLTTAQNGNAAMARLSNNLNQSISAVSAFQAGRSLNADSGAESHTGEDITNRDTHAATRSQEKGRNAQSGTSQGSSVTAASGIQNQVGETFNTGRTAQTSKNASQNQINMMAASMGAQLSAEAGLGINTGGGGTVRPVGVADPKIAQEVAKKMTGLGATPEQIQTAMTANGGGHHKSATGAGIRLGGGLGGSAGKNYVAQDGTSFENSNGSLVATTVANSASAMQVGGRMTTNTAGADSSQQDRQADVASLSSARDHSETTSSGGRTTTGFRGGASVTDSQSHSTTQNLSADPEFMHQVQRAAQARDPSMNQARFLSQSDERLMQLATDYAERQGMLKSAKTLSPSRIDGGKLPQSPQSISETADNTMAAMPDDTAILHGKDVRQTGFKGVKRVSAPTAMPKPAGNSQTLINDQKQRMKQWAAPLEGRVAGATQSALGQGSSQVARVGRLVADDAASTADGVVNTVKDVVNGRKK